MKIKPRRMGEIELAQAREETRVRRDRSEIV
jgi:hypothetical protein